MEKLLSFGAYPDVGLADARLRGAEAKVALGQGADPGAKAKARGVTTFEDAARAWHANRLASLDPGHASRLLTRIERDAFWALGATNLRAVTSAHVLAMLRRVEARGALDVSRRLKQHVSQIYRFAIPQGWADTNPAEHLDGLLKPKPRVRIWLESDRTSCRGLFAQSTSMMGRYAEAPGRYPRGSAVHASHMGQDQ
jgi:hypothetical protein